MQALKPKAGTRKGFGFVSLDSFKAEAEFGD
jgi:hypothetical protein